MQTISMVEKAGRFCENKDIAREIREEVLLPALESDEAVTFDFNEVSGVTQSFIHALVSEALRRYPEIAYDRIFYKNACAEVQEIISIVYAYMQQG